MTQTHKQQYKYRLTGSSFKSETKNEFKFIMPVIVLAILYLITCI